MFVLPEGTSTNIRNAPKRISTTLPLIGVFFLGILVCGAIYFKYLADISHHKQEYGLSVKAEAIRTAEQIEIRFNLLYQGLRAIARLPRVKNINAANDDALVLARQDMQEIYNLLFSFIHLSEIYITPKNFDPEQFDPKTHKAFAPILSFDKFTTDLPLAVATTDTVSADTNTAAVEIFEYRVMRDHLKWLRHNAARESSIENLIYPALVSNEILTSDNSRHSDTDQDNNHRMGVVYSLPYYDNVGNLAGTVVGVLLTDVLRDLLPNSNFVIYNANNDYRVSTNSPGAWQNSTQWIKAGKANPQLIYSDSITLNLPAQSNSWHLWIGTQEDEFWQLPQVYSAKRFTIMALLATLLLTTSLGIIVMMQIKQRRFAQGENAVLEFKVNQRTKELALQKKMLVKRTSALEESDARARAVLENAAESIIIIDDQGSIETFNKAAESTFGFNANEVIGHHIGLLLPSLGNKLPQNYLEKYQGIANSSKSKRKHEILAVHKDQSTFPAKLHLSELKLANMQLYIGVVRDISESKKTEHTINTAKEEAEQSSRAKSEFLANMSHELRTPLNAIIGYCELLKEEVQLANDSHYINDLNNISTSGNHLLHLINSILDLSKIEAGKMELHLEEFDLQSIIEEAVMTLQPLVSKNGNTMTYQGSPNLGLMHADTIKTQQIVLNLLSNANKFTANGQIAISAEQIEISSTHWLNLKVTDTGIGMSEKQLNNLFSEFTQGDSSTTKRYGGTGLGMAISLQFCEMMGGTIYAQSLPDKGSTFTVKLPMAVIGPKIDPKLVRFNTNTAPTDIKRSKISRVLVIGDNKQSTDLIERFLTREGFYADSADQLERAQASAKEHPPEVILIDENSLDLDGWFNINAIKNIPGLENIPIVMLTKSKSRELATAMGITDFLSKPVQRNRLIEMVVKYVRRPMPGDGSGSYILVVEDDIKNGDILKRHLESEGLRVKIAENGLEGLAFVKEQPPDLIFLDIIMPKMDGFEFVENLRDNPAWQTIPVVILTAIELSNEQRNRLSSHVETILFKTDIEPSALLTKLRDVVVTHLRKNNTE